MSDPLYESVRISVSPVEAWLLLVLILQGLKYLIHFCERRSHYCSRLRLSSCT